VEAGGRGPGDELGAEEHVVVLVVVVGVGLGEEELGGGAAVSPGRSG
jgi:hypothetical protein